MNRSFILTACVVFLMGSFVFAQKKVTGTVSDSEGMPLPGVSVLIKGTVIGVSTDFDGKFSLSLSQNNTVIEVSSLGFKTKEINISGQLELNIVLEENAEALDEVLVTAQGIKKSKKALGYAVSKLDSEELEQRPEANMANTLRGKVAGLTILETNGQTGSSTAIRIRGSISITQSNTPLIVVDNVPFAGSTRDIDPNDIKSLSVLKGFSAAILYGSEGRNGVILIETKSGNTELGSNKTTATYAVTSYINTVSQLPEFQNKYGQGQEGSFSPTLLSVWGPAFDQLDEVSHPYANLSNIFPEYENVAVPYEAKKNNLKNIFNIGAGSIHSLNISTSKDDLSFNFSAGYTDEEGIIDHNDIKRFNIGIGGKAQITDKLSISATMKYSTRKTDLVQSSSIFSVLYYLPRNLDITEFPYQNPLTGESVYYRNDTNPLWILHNTGVKYDVVRVFGTFNTNYQFNKSFGLSYRVGLANEQNDTFSYSNKGGYDDNNFKTGYLNIDYDKEVVVDQTLIFNYNKKISESLSLDAQFGANSKLTKIKSLASDSQGQINYGFLRPNNYSTSESNFSTGDENIAGAFGQFQLAYKSYLYTTLSGRNDWGSTVEKENQSLFYPGASMSFIPTSAFNFGGNIINYLKFRGAYGTSSGFPGRYTTRNILIIDTKRFASADGSLPITNRYSTTYANPDLRPELHKEIEFGIETKLFKNRVNLESSFYKRISEDQIVESPIAPSTGFDVQYINLGRVDSKGVELDLGIDIIKNKNFSWNFRNIFTSTASLVVKTTAVGARVNINDDRYAVEGQPLGVIVGDYALRDQEGNLLISGNGSSTRVGEVIVSSDVGIENKVIGDPNPEWGLTNINSFGYKNFTLSAQMEYSHGGKISSRAVEDQLERGVTRDTENRNGSFVIPGFLADDETGKILLDSNGDKIPNTIQLNGLRTVFSNYYNANDISMWDASVFRIREIALSYRLKSKKMDKLPFNKIDFTLSGRNLWYIAPNFPKYSNYDPESDNGLGNNNIPSTKRFAFSITATF